MRTRRWVRSFFVITLLLGAAGCENHYSTTTVVSVDGSVDRTVEWKHGSESKGEISWGDLPLPLDSTWQVSWKAESRHDTSVSGSVRDDSTYFCTATKHFASFDELSAEYSHRQDTTKLQMIVHVEKRFRWFYTYYDYTETYLAFHPIVGIPLQQFFTPEELRRIMNDEKSDSLKARHEEWVERNSYEFVYRRLVAAARRMNDSGLTVSALEAKKEELLQALIANGKGAVDFDLVRDILGSPSVEELREPFELATNELEENFKLQMAIAGTYTNTVVLPGVILETNAKEVSGSRSVWDFSADQVCMMDVAMHVESRVVNTWAIIVSAVVVLGLICVPLALQYRKR